MNNQSSINQSKHNYIVPCVASESEAHKQVQLHQVIQACEVCTFLARVANQKVDHKEEWKCYKLHFIFQYII